MFHPSTNYAAYAHRFAYESVQGAIPAGFVIDHLCHNRSCVNPNHLVAVTKRLNALRQSHVTLGPDGELAECINGHPLSGVNLYTSPQGRRGCRTCRAIASRKYESKVAA